MPDTSQRFAVNTAWLIKLRWVAIVGQLATIVMATTVLNIRLVMWPLAMILGLTVISNLVLMVWFSRFPDWIGRQAGAARNPASTTHILGLVMTMDMLSLTTLLYVTGGPTNPFWLFFFVNVSLSAVLLDRNWAWGLNLLSIVCFAGLMVRYIPVSRLDLGPALDPIAQRGGLSMAQAGLLTAFVTCSGVIVYFMTRVTGELREQEVDLRMAQQQQSRNEKIEALGTLAAGAAHELATPLTTIALVAKDVEQSLQTAESPWAGEDSLIEDVGLIRQQLDRCKKILDRMASHAGETVGEMMQQVSVVELVREVCEGLDRHDRQVATEIDESTADRFLQVPLDALSQALRGLVQNAIDASPAGGSVRVRVSGRDNGLRWEIVDQGAGMSEEVLRRVSEPFFTTKQPGKGMGLGVFLAKNVIERLDGEVRFESRTAAVHPASGTTVLVHLPVFATPQETVS